MRLYELVPEKWVWMSFADVDFYFDIVLSIQSACLAVYMVALFIVCFFFFVFVFGFCWCVCSVYVYEYTIYCPGVIYVWQLLRLDSLSKLQFSCCPSVRPSVGSFAVCQQGESKATAKKKKKWRRKSRTLCVIRRSSLCAHRATQPFPFRMTYNVINAPNSETIDEDGTMKRPLQLCS